MANNSELARLGVTGQVYVAPLGTAVPTDLSAWGTGWTDLGYISDEGVTEAVDEDQETFTPWQAHTPIRVETTSSVITFQFTAWESKFETISLYYRTPEDEFSETNGVVTFHQGAKPKRDLRMFGFDIMDGDLHRRIVVLNGEVTERDSIEYRSESMIGYNMTITAYPDSTGRSITRMFEEGWSLPS